MLWGAAAGALELRRENGGVRVSGRFPYGSEIALAAGRGERIEARAFASRIEAGDDIHLLSVRETLGQPIRRNAGSPRRRRGAGVRRAAGTSWAQDFLAAHRAGLVRGLSPGFRVTEGGERVERRGDGLLRSITAADLFEISAVTRPAYPAAQIEARCWETSLRNETCGRSQHHLKRWRI